MIHDAVKKQDRSILNRIAPYLVLALMLAASVWLWRFWANHETTRVRADFDEYCERISEDIAERLNAYKMILQGGAGTFISSEEVTREEWGAYYEYRQVRTLYPGIQGLGFAEAIAQDELARHVERIRAEGFPEYTVRPEGERANYTPVVFLEPFDAIHRPVLGYDMSSEPVRRATMERARDTASPAMTGRLQLVIEDAYEEVQPGCILYVPVFAGGVPPASVEARRAALRGYAYGIFRVKDLMRGIFPEAPERVAFELYDGATVAPEALLFASSELDGGLGKEQRARFTSHSPLELYGHTWSLTFYSTPQFEAAEAHHLPWIILAAGIAVSILVFLLMRSQQNLAAKAEALAERLTVDLRKTSETLRATLYSIGDAVISTDTEGHVASMNPVAESLTGWSEQEATGQPLGTVFRIVNEHTGRPVESPVRQVLEEGLIVSLANHTLLLARDGRKIPIADSGAPMRNAAGEITGVVLVFRDQTEERKARLALEEKTQKLQLVFDNMFDLVSVADLEGNLKFVSASHKILNDDLDSLIGRNVLEFVHPEDLPGISSVFRDSPAKGDDTQKAEYRYRCADGSYLWFETVNRTIRDEEGNPSEMLFSTRDVTERKQAEADRSARREAEQANRAKSIFLSSMSHEIRTPLNSVLGFTQILERDASLTPRQSDMIHTIARSGRHLLNLINDILDMAKIESGRLELKPADFCLHDLLDDLEMMFRSRAQAKQLQLLVEQHDSVPRYVNADEAKLRQVLINLTGNAVKFTKTGGVALRIRADAEPGRSDGDAKAVRLVVEVEDSGPGIAEDELHRIFEPFRQTAANQEAGGTGLGLAVSRRIVELMGGSLTATSEVGKGSCFRLDVPVTPAEGAAQEKVQEARQVVGLEPGTGPFRILIADDRKDNRSLLAALLEPVGFDIREAVNGQEALDAFEAWSPHAVLMDMRMPVLDGYEATRRIKATKKGRTTPVIAVTASAFDDAEKEVFAAGVDGYVRKPFRSEEIFAVLEECLGLRYVYAEGTGQAPENTGVQPLARADLAALPEALRQAMREAVDEGDMAGLQALIDQVEETDAEAARKLRNRADQYDYETLTQVLTKQEKGEPDE